jgi:CheY-like chemotaxis protein
MNFNDWTVPVASQFPAKRTLHVLLVDDIALNRELLRALLQHWGHVVEELDCGERAVERVAAGGIDLALIDISMPGMDGLQATHRIREHAGPSGCTPVWVVTARAYEQDIAQACAAGADGYLSMPVSFQMLSEVLQALESGCITGRTMHALGTGSSVSPARYGREVVSHPRRGME